MTALLVGPASAVSAAAEQPTVADITLAVGFGEADAEVLRLYHAFFDRQPDATGALYWIDLARSGTSITDIAFNFAKSREFGNKYDGASNTEFLQQVYQNVLGRQPDSAGFEYWLNLLDSGELGQGSAVRWIAANAEFITTNPYPIEERPNSGYDVSLDELEAIGDSRAFATGFCGRGDSGLVPNPLEVDISTGSLADVDDDGILDGLIAVSCAADVPGFAVLFGSDRRVIFDDGLLALALADSPFLPFEFRHFEDNGRGGFHVLTYMQSSRDAVNDLRIPAFLHITLHDADELRFRGIYQRQTSIGSRDFFGLAITEPGDEKTYDPAKAAVLLDPWLGTPIDDSGWFDCGLEQRFVDFDEVSLLFQRNLAAPEGHGNLIGWSAGRSDESETWKLFVMPELSDSPFLLDLTDIAAETGLEVDVGLFGFASIQGISSGLEWRMASTDGPTSFPSSVSYGSGVC